ncbi:hypothetical protein OROGR_012083 [Orobanche gracilis]
MHMGTECTSFHNIAQRGWDNLLNEVQDIRNVFEKFTTEEREKNRLRLSASIFSVCWCAFQAVAFRGHNKNPNSINKGNFLEMLEALGEFSTKLKERMICEDIGGGRFCLFVDEALDESHKEQMSVVLRFVNKDGLIIERFFGLVHVRDTMAQTLKDGIYSLLSHYNLDVKSIRGQGYDGADNMRGQFKGTGSGLNQIGTLQRVGDTRRSSHLRSVSSLIKMFSPTCEVLLKIVEEGTGSIRGDADLAYESMTTFDFVFVLHLEKEIMEITDLRCQALQRQDQDIFNALRLVASTKLLLQKMKDKSWNDLLSVVKSFCQVRNIDIPDLSSSYRSRGPRARNEQGDHTLEHHYRVDIFYEAINCQLMELDHRFSDSAMELLRLASSLDPKNAYETFRSVDVLQVMEKFYPEDFSDHEKTILKMQLQHYEIDVVQHADYKKLTFIAELGQWLVRTRREITFDLIYRVISLLLTLPVSTATIERSFSAMNIVKTRIQNKIEDEFLNDSLILYIERELAEKITLDEIIEDFKAAKDRRVPL